jgi:acetyl-CoA carboxylase biotin carboxyl carrier protein
MDLAYLKKLVRIVEHSGVDEIEVEEEGLRVRIARNIHTNSVGVQTAALQPVAALPGQAPQSPSAELSSAPAVADKAEVKLHEIRSPIVGTFYRAPAPDADPYVEIGQTVQPKTVLCIIEAMKLMNEIESDVAGKIVKILVDNGKPVEYNQPLYLIEPM